MAKADDDLLTTAEVANLLKRPIATVNRWAAEGKLPIFHRNPGRTGANIYRREDVERFAAARSAA